jgi:hypothetical protein
MKKKPLLLPMTFINGFEKNCGTFRGVGSKNPFIVNNIGLVCLGYIYITFFPKKTMTMGWMLT